MPDDAAAVRFTVLDPSPGAESLDETGLADLYAYPDDLRACWVRGNMIASLDGGATDDGKSGSLGGSGDRAMFLQLRQLADVILVGAGTVRTENYSGAQCSAAQRQDRQAPRPGRGAAHRRRHQPRQRLDHDARIFTRTEVPPLILTSANAVADANARLGSVAEVDRCLRVRTPTGSTRRPL